MPDTDPNTDWEISDAPDGPAYVPRCRRGAKDWEPLRAKAQKRARVELVKQWENPATGRIIWSAEFRRFCFKDYGKNAFSLHVYETPHSVSIRNQGNYGHGKWEGGRRLIATVKSGRLQLYRVMGKRVVHAKPFHLQLLGALPESTYQDAHARFSRQLARMLRSKARANGVRLPKVDDFQQLLIQGLWPAVKAVQDHYAAVRPGQWEPDRGDRWLLRHMRCSPAELPKRMTGYGSKAVTRLFWEAMKPPSPSPMTAGIVGLNPTGVEWKSKWAWLATLRTFLPVDYTQALLRAPKVLVWEAAFTDAVPAIRKLLKQWEPKRVLQLLLEPKHGHLVRDTLNMLAQRRNNEDKNRVDLAGTEWWQEPQPVPRTRDLKELHDWLAADQRTRMRWRQRVYELKRRADMSPEDRERLEARERAERAPFQHHEALLAVQGKTVVTSDGCKHTIVLPKDPDELLTWGEGMSNCIGGYGHAIRSGRSLILGVRTEGSPRPVEWGIELWNVRFRREGDKDWQTSLEVNVNGERHEVEAPQVVPGSVAQFRGRFNHEPPDELRAKVETVLREAGLIQVAFAAKMECVAGEEVAPGQIVAQGEDGAVYPIAA